MQKSLLTEIIYGDLRRRRAFRVPDAFIKRYGGPIMANHDYSDKLQFDKYSPHEEILGMGTDEGVFYYGQVKQFLNYYGSITDENVAQPTRIEPDSRGHGISSIKFLQNNKIGLMSLGGFFLHNRHEHPSVLSGPVQTVYCPSDENPNLIVMGTRDDLLLTYDIRDPNNVKLKSTINPAGTPSRKIKTPKRARSSTPKSSSRKMPSPVQAEKLSDICHLYDHFFATTSTSNEKGVRVWDMRYTKHYSPVQTFKIEKYQRTNFGAYSMNLDRDRVNLVVGCTDGVFREYAFRSACTNATRLYSGGSISTFQQNFVHSPFSDHFVGPLRDGIGIWDKQDKPICVDTWKQTQYRPSFSEKRSISNREVHFIEPRFSFKAYMNDALAHCDWSPSGRYIAMVTRQSFIICDGESQWSREIANRDLTEMSGRPRLPSPSDSIPSVVHNNELQANGYKKRRMEASEKQSQPGSSRVITIDEDFEPSRLMKKTQSRMDDYLKGPKKEQSVRNNGQFRTASGKRVSKEVLPVITAETAVIRPVRQGPTNPYRSNATNRNNDRNQEREFDRSSYNSSTTYQPSGLFRPRSLNPAYKVPLAVDGGNNQKNEETENLEGDDLLFSTDPVLKAMEKNIIDMIKSEIIVLDLSLTWDDVVGLESAKRVLREIIILPFKRPDVFKGIRAPPKGVLLFGPPGTGKTLIARCVANQCKATFFNISASSLTSKWVGEGEKLVRALFRVARLKEPSVIFIDELDSLLSSRRESEHESSRRIKTELLVQMDGVCSNSNERLLILAATNKPQELDEAARRRFAKRLYIALPTKEARLAMLAKHLSSLMHDIDEESMRKLADKTEGFSGADMRQLCCEAAMGPIREIDDMSTVDIETVKEEDIRPISFSDFEDALCSVKRTVLQSELDGYMEWDEQFGCSKLLKCAQANSPAKALPLAAIIDADYLCSFCFCSPVSGQFQMFNDKLCAQSV
ncbi:AAA domain-containing protein [Aphelenchoides besseyi]|nr:AAA domain-containing protein [Aphelenchoides besseyi]